MASFSLVSLVHSEISHSLPLPSFPFCTEPSNLDSLVADVTNASGPARTRPSDAELAVEAERVAALLETVDIGYLSIREELRSAVALGPSKAGTFRAAVECHSQGVFHSTRTGKNKRKVAQENGGRNTSMIPTAQQLPGVSKNATESAQAQAEVHAANETGEPSKPKLKRRKTILMNELGQSASRGQASAPTPSSDPITAFSDLLDEYFEKTDVIEGQGSEKIGGSLLSVRELSFLSGELLKLRDTFCIQNLAPALLMRLMNLLNHHIQVGYEKELEEDEGSGTNVSIMLALEAIQAAIIVMTAPKMPKQVYNEEIIDRIVQVTKYQIVHNIFMAYDPGYRQLHKDEGVEVDDMDEGAEGATGRKARRKSKGKKATAGKISMAVTVLLDKICSIVAALSELLIAARLQDAIVLQLTKTVLATFTVENIELLQLKCLVVMCTVFKHYPQHRTIIMDDFVAMLWKLPSSKRGLRTYHLSEDHKQIQMMSALLIHLIQCSADLSPFEVKAKLEGDPALASSTLAMEPSKGAKESRHPEGNPAMRCFDQAKEIATYFWKSVLQRWGTAKTSEGIDAKGIMDNLVADLLDCLNVPELPAANLLLQILCILIMTTGGLQSKDYAIKAAAVDLLGVVAGRLKKDSCVTIKERLWMLEDSGSNAGARESGGKPAMSQRGKKGVCVACRQQKGSSFFVTCSSCQRSFHGACVTLEETDLVNGRSWLCYCCICKQQLEQMDKEIEAKPAGKAKTARRNSTSSDGDVGTTEGHGWKIGGQTLLQQIMLNHLQGREEQGDTMSLHARSFYLCWWYRDEADVDGSFDFFRSRLQTLKQAQNSGFTSTPLKREAIVRISMELGHRRPLAKGFDKILEGILMVLQDQASIPRAKALKAVGGLVEIDPTMLEDDRVKQAVEGRFLDTSISVREAAVDLVGKYMMISPAVALKYYDRIAERIRDTGVSVRKKVIKIIKDVVLSIEDFPRKIEACKKIMERITDDETSIRDLVVKTFHELWFEEHSPRRSNVADVNGIPHEVAERTQQLVEVVMGTSVQLPLVVAIIKRSLEQDANPQTAKSGTMDLTPQGAVRKRCEMMCRCMLEGVLQAYEISSVESEARALPYVTGLQAFCMVDPALLAPSNDPSRFAVTLQPYLKTQPDQNQAAIFVQGVVSIIDSLLPLLRRPSATFLEELEKDLQMAIVTHRYLSVVQACIKCLCALRNIHQKAVQPIAQLVRYHYRKLNERSQQLEEKNKPVASRFLFILGVLGRYAADAIDDGDIGDVSMEGIISTYIFYLKTKDFVVKSRALQGLGFIFITKPELMLVEEMKGMLEATLSAKAHPRLKKQTLVNLLDYLHDVEGKLAAGAQHPTGIEAAGGDVPVAAGAGDINNNCGGIIQVYWERILDRALDQDMEVRQAALKVIEVVLRQGLVHPVTSVPTLIALEVDQHEANAKLAHRLVTMMNEKYSQFLENKLGDGLQESFDFVSSGAAASVESTRASGQGRLNGGKGRGKDCLSVFSEASRDGISRVYKLIRSGRMSRNRFIASIVRKFDNTNILRDACDLAFLEYCTEILASLPFGLPDEPLYLIYSINRLVQLHGGTLQSVIKGAIAGNGPLAEAAQKVLAEMEAEKAEQGEEAYNLFPTDNSQVEERVALPGEDIRGASEEALEKVKADCKQAMALAMLLVLKRHLKYTYNLSDARCQAFQPSEPVMKGEMLSRRDYGPLSCKDLPLEPPDTMRQILKQYHKFKTLLREDSTSDFTGFNATTVKRRASASARVSGGTVNETGEASSGPVSSTNGMAVPAATRARRRRSEPGPSRQVDEEEDDNQDEDGSDEEDNGGKGKRKGRQNAARGRNSAGGRAGRGKKSLP